MNLTCAELIHGLQEASTRYGEDTETNIERVTYPVQRVGGGNSVRLYTDLSESFNDLDDLQGILDEAQAKVARLRREPDA